MLSRPPKLLTEQNQSQIYTDTQRSKNSLSKNKVKKKESSLGGNRNRAISNASDFSNHSKSPNHEPQNNFDVIIKDNVSVGSHTSGKSRKNKKKETSLKSQRSNKVLNYKRQMQESIKVMEYGNDDRESSNTKTNSDLKNVVIEQSEVKNVPTFESPRESPYKFMTKPSNRQTGDDHQTRKPFSEIDIDDDDDLPVIKIKQNQAEPKKLKQTPKIAQREETKRFGQMLQENRRNIINAQPANFQQNKSIANNNSQISQSFWQTSNIDNTSQAQSRRSKSKLGTLFKQKSKEKLLNNSSSIQPDGSLQKSRDRSRSRKIFANKNKNIGADSETATNKNYPKMEQSGFPTESRMVSNQFGASKLVSKFIEPKKMDESQDLFDGGDLSRSELNLSQSHQAGYNNRTLNHNKTDSNINSSFNQKDSFCFHLEPDKSKRRGLALVSKNRREHNEKQFVPVADQLISIDLGNTSNKEGRQLIKIPEVLESKQIDTKNARNKLQNNLRENEKYLAASGFDKESAFDEQEAIFKKRQQQEKLDQLQRRNAERQNRLKKQDEERQRALKQKEEYLKKRQEQFQREQADRERKIKEQKQQRERQRQKQFQKKQREQEERQERQRERQKQIQRAIQAQKMKQMQEYERKQRELEQRQRKLMQRQAEMKLHKQRQLEYQTNQAKQQKRGNQDAFLSNIPSTYSKDHSSNGSQRSKSVKKNQKKQSSINPIKKPTRKYFGDISPRGEQSFYEEDQPISSSKEEKEKISVVEPSKETNISKPKLISFSDDEDVSQNNGRSDMTNKFNTDVNFYENSIRVPSSKPPLSRKSVSSKGKSKPKQSSISKKKPVQKSTRLAEDQKKQPKKLTLIELAMQKNYEPRSDSEFSHEGSQYSFGSREQSCDGKNSRKSYGSKNSSRSQKKQSVIVKQKDSTIRHRPPRYQSKSSHEEEMAEIQSQRERMKQLQEEYDQPIVSKDCFYIDERGKLVKKDLIIRGNKVVSHQKVEFNPNQVYDRLRKSRQKRRSRSRDRSRERSLGRSQVSNTMTSFQSNNKTNSNGPMFVESDAYIDSACQSSENFFGNANQNRQHFATMNYMGMGQKVQGRSRKTENFCYSGCSGELPSNSIYSNMNHYPSKQQSATLNEFLKPIETIYTNNQYQQNTQNYGNGYSGQQQRDQQRMQRKRGLQRTQKSASKRIK